MAITALSILVIDENQARGSIIESGLRSAGQSQVTTVSELQGIARVIQREDPDVILMDLGSPNRDMLESVFQLTRSLKRPIALFVDQSDQASMEAAIDAGVSAYVVDGLTKERVQSVMDLAISRFNAFAKLERELEVARYQLEERKLIDRAKGILMKTKGIDEPQAYALLRRSAMNQNRKIAEIAQSLITASSLLDIREPELR
ncbi:ANTAR domain-containing response regulator [Flexibacterium corallicola]|uniref:ANTAR domain-containing response regulator n=1 Tax=Flexibacterium corallicola TaxID=3037259 RepID=UPI00286F62C1|nr:ANTAR domain-containing protein [Pseudovibrio sp. M1P-2-3]